MLRTCQIACGILLFAGCSGPGGASLDLYLDRKGCSAPCTVDRFDLYVGRGACLYAWRTGLGGGEQLLADMELDDGEELTVDVLARCGSDHCVRCAARQTFRAASGSRVDLALKPASCAAAPRTTTPCTRCLPGPDGYCDDKYRVACPASGRTERAACPQWCVDGACSNTCPKESIYYRDGDGDTYGDSAAQQKACSQPAGYAERGGDCDDTDPKVHPGQTAYFTVKNKNGDFDYDCNDAEEPQHPTVVSCRRDAAGACVGDGWLVSTPFCGTSGTFVTCQIAAFIFCDKGPLSTRTQACH
jgi:hypothetical protein